MSIIATAVRHLMAAGVTGEALVAAIADMEANQAPAVDMVAKRFAARRDKCTGLKDSNRIRRGMSDSKWRALRQRIFERDNHECQYCGASDDLTCDHIVPLMRGGTNDNENLNTACRSCNSSKGDKMLNEWRAM